MSPKKNVTELSNKEKIDVIHHILDIFWDKAGDIRSYNDVQEDLNDHNYECDTHLCDLIPEAYNRIHDLEDTDEFIDCGEGPKLIPELEDERPPSIPNDDTTTPWWHEEDIESRVEVLENMKRKVQKKMVSESSGEPTELKDLKEGEHKDEMQKFIDELTEFKNSEKKLYTIEKAKDGQIKALFVNLRGGYEVHHGNEVVMENLQPLQVVEKYFEL